MNSPKESANIYILYVFDKFLYRFFNVLQHLKYNKKFIWAAKELFFQIIFLVFASSRNVPAVSFVSLEMHSHFKYFSTPIFNSPLRASSYALAVACSNTID